MEGALKITNNVTPKLVLKLPPDDMSGAKLEKVVEAGIKYGFVAIAATNTSSDAEFKESWGITEPGGISGMPLRKRANAVIKETVAIAGGRIPVIGVGGIMTPDDAQEKIHLGAKGVGLYTGLIYDPFLLAKTLERLAGIGGRR